MKSGFVTLIGRPNTGKSTLLNSIIKEKVAIISSKPQTTRNLIQGIYNEEDTQIVFVDTPGIHKPVDKLGVALNAQAYYSINDVDVVLFVCDASAKYGKGDQFIIDKLANIEKPVFLILNKIDKLTDDEILSLKSCYNLIIKLIKYNKITYEDIIYYLPDQKNFIDFFNTNINKERG